ncbi:MAG: DUF4349 domain-containing protein [Erysipelotrichaceae bacterium]|nr:DUF4349 domain-containing protein [Erysipelotrichaceae bacterium]
MKKKSIISAVIVIILIVSLIFNVYHVIIANNWFQNTTEETIAYTGSNESYGLASDKSASDAATESSDSEMLLINAYISLAIEDNETADSLIREYVKTNGGKIVNSNNYLTTDDYKVFTLEVKIPQTVYDAFMSYLKEQGKVENASETSYDVINQYNDNSLRLTMLQNKLDRLNALMEQAQNMSDLITIEDAVSQTIYEIELLNSSQNELEYDNEYASVNITINPVMKESVETSGFDDILINAFTASLNAFLTVIAWLIRMLFYILPYAVIGGLGYLGYRRLRKLK